MHLSICVTMFRISVWKESITGFCFNRRLNKSEVDTKKRDYE